jgi:hypothetical protein
MPTRRAALAGMLGAAAAPVAAGCRPFGGRDQEPTPDEVIRDRVLAGKRTLLEQYAATLERHPGLRTRLAPLRAEHEAHVTALNGSPKPTPTASSAGASPAPPSVPATAGAALAKLATAERAAADARLADLAGASPRLARVLAAMGGCEAAHAALLGGA